ncbi:MAG TPA: pantoate--beta-alanine ligase [Armatimonadota bacterium]|jgi:pantoate--beta-alanine ligase
MEVTSSIAEVSEACRVAKLSGLSVGFVPTMGYLHEGHVSLLRAARAENELVVLSIFVNPTQFGPQEDLERYPRDLDRDCKLAEAAGTNLTFTPTAEAMYPRGYTTTVSVKGLTELWEGASRPGHFDGVATVVLKLLNVTQPDRAYFGAKDYQQLQVVQRMVEDLNLAVDIVGLPTVREPDGLALSSRNVYLSREERERALVLPSALAHCRRLLEGGERRGWVVRQAGEERIQAQAGVELDYLAVAHPRSLQPMDLVDREAVLLAAVRAGKTRLIDNLLWEETPSQSDDELAG